MVSCLYESRLLFLSYVREINLRRITFIGTWIPRTGTIFRLVKSEKRNSKRRTLKGEEQYTKCKLFPPFLWVLRISIRSIYILSVIKFRYRLEHFFIPFRNPRFFTTPVTFSHNSCIRFQCRRDLLILWIKIVGVPLFSEKMRERLSIQGVSQRCNNFSTRSFL